MTLLCVLPARASVINLPAGQTSIRLHGDRASAQLGDPVRVQGGGAGGISGPAQRAALTGSAFAPEEVSGTTGFTDIGAGLPGGVATWGDYDNDGDLDVLAILGGNSPVYRNDAGVFSDIGAGLPGGESVAWGDYDNDGDLDMLVTGWTPAFQSISRIYRNDGGTFTDIAAGLPDFRLSSVAWGDYDNDGDLDVLLSGISGSPGAQISRIYRNDAGTFNDIGAGLPGAYYSSVAWGDYDNDGDLDILLTGISAPVGGISRVYRNDAGTFTDIAAGLPGLGEEYDTEGASVAWGDYDNDGDLDILLTGFNESSGATSGVYRNDAGTFTDIAAGLPGVFGSSGAWGDYDNDGDLDILITGSTFGGSISRIYRNDAGTFTDIAAGLPGGSSVAWGDYDNDGDLDFLLNSQIYRNDGLTPNTPPAAPGNLSVTLDGTEATFTWDAATDPETPSPGLTYNLRIGTTPGSGDLCSPMAHAVSGYRRVARLGNTNHRTSWTIALPDPLPPQVYWSVQAVDAAFAGSPFAPEQSVSTTVDVPGPGTTRPTAFMLLPSAPNPMTDQTTIAFDLPRVAPVALRIYDVRGRRVRTLLDGQKFAAGRHRATWDGRGQDARPLGSGVYWVEMTSTGFRSVRRMVLIR